MIELRKAFRAGVDWAWGETRHRATRSTQADVEALRRYPDKPLEAQAEAGELVHELEVLVRSWQKLIPEIGFPASHRLSNCAGQVQAILDKSRPAPAANTEGLRAIRIDRYDPACSLCREQAGRPNANTGDFLCNEHARVIGRAALRGEPSTAPTSEHRCPHGHAMELQWVCETCGERSTAAIIPREVFTDAIEQSDAKAYRPTAPTSEGVKKTAEEQGIIRKRIAYEIEQWMGENWTRDYPLAAQETDKILDKVFGEASDSMAHLSDESPEPPQG